MSSFDLPCFRMKPSENDAQFIDVVCTQEAIAKMASMAPVVILGVKQHSIVHGSATDSGLCVLRLEVVATEMFTDPLVGPSLQESVSIPAQGDSNEELPGFCVSDPALQRLRDVGFVR